MARGLSQTQAARSRLITHRMVELRRMKSGAAKIGQWFIEAEKLCPGAASYNAQVLWDAGRRANVFTKAQLAAGGVQ